ncbi:MAG: hypothetical protein ACYSTS_08735 [Planctomycetota bacterium]
MPHMNLPLYDILKNTLCFTEEGFDYLKEKFMVNSVDRKGEKKKKHKHRIPDNKFKRLCKDIEREGCKKELGERIFFKELSEMSKLTKYDKTCRGYKTWQSVKKRYYQVFPSKKTKHTNFSGVL